MLEGLVDVYLVDFKYANAHTAQRLSHAADYPEIALDAIERMILQVGEAHLDEKGYLRKGVIVRHLVLPGYVDDSLAALKVLHERFNARVMMSIMNQFTIVDDAFDREAYGLSRSSQTSKIEFADSMSLKSPRILGLIFKYPFLIAIFIIF